MNTPLQAAGILAAENDARERPGDYAAFEALGDAYFKNERLDDALRAYQNAVALNPAATSAYDEIGHIHYRIGYAPAAVAAYEQAIANDPHFVKGYYGLRILYSARLGEHERAIQVFERALSANPADPFLTACLASTYARQGQIEKALDILERLVVTSPSPFAFSWLSILYLHQRRYDQADAACRREIALEENPHSHRLLGYIHYAQGRNGEAIAELERALALAPEDYEVQGALSKVYRDSGNLALGEQHYAAARKLALQDDDIGQACFHAVSGDLEQSLACLETGLAKNQAQTGWIRIDPEFTFIQDDPRFQALINPASPA